MTGYIIKVTVTSGRHEGHTYFLQKGGYVHDETFDWEWTDRAYKTKGIAERICRKLKENNELSYTDERVWNDIQTKRGHKGKELFIYEHEEYEPFEIKVIG